MLGLKNFSINVKLILLVLVSSGAALLIASSILAVNAANLIRSSKIQQLSALAKVLGASSTAALSFDDSAAGRELLSSLSLQPTVHFACLYNSKDQVFATYNSGKLNNYLAPYPKKEGSSFVADNYLDITQQILHDNEKVGTIYLHASMEDLQNQLIRYTAVVALVLLISLGVAVGLSSLMQRMISVPILNLAKTAQLVSVNRDYSVRVQKYASDELGTLYNEFNYMLDQIERGEQELQQARGQLEVRVGQLSEANQELTREIAERKRAQEELGAVHKQLLDAARRAGMAEVATGVLHNVGNILNSLNVSATLVTDRLRNSKCMEMSRALELINQHADDLGVYLTQDEKGKQLPGFLNLLASHLERERNTILREMESLTKNVNHIKTIVSMQQSYAGMADIDEAVSLADLMEDALMLNASSFGKHEIEVIRDYAAISLVQMQKQKVLQILVNLIRNARDALAEKGGPDRRMTLRIRISGEEDKIVEIDVIDNGVGIREENLTRIFSHGFTTKKHGHGFGLHSSANAAKELGGSLTAYSEGPDQGAVFTLELPFKPAEVLV